ncbi:MAG: hypothetical protein HQK55_16580 [Deltaproteobacteria bacterium]|nr:hypothetical protein [Deltaproteobacteria bacterium]
MDVENKDYSLNSLVNSDVTGRHDAIEDFQLIIYPFGKYEILVRVTMDGRFLGINEVRLNKSFIDYKKLSTSGDYHDVDEFYKE